MPNLDAHEHRRFELQDALARQVQLTDRAVIQLVSHDFPRVVINPDETVPGRISFNWTGPNGRHVELIVFHADTVRVLADLPINEADVLIDAMLGPDPRRYGDLFYRVGTLADAPAGTHLVDHEDGTPAEHNMTVRPNGTVNFALNRLDFAHALTALIGFHAPESVPVPAGNATDR